MSRYTRVLVTLALALTMLVAPATAYAAPIRWESVHVTLHPEQSGTTMMVSGSLPKDTPLPAEVELAVPAGSELSWAGEILGGDVSQDPSVTYTKATVGTSDVYSFRLTKAHVGQLEVSAPSAHLTEGSGYRVALEWTPAQDVPLTRMSVRLPNAATVASSPAGAERIPSQGQSFGYLTKDFKNVKAGKPLTLAFSYEAPAGSLGAPASNGAAQAQTAATGDPGMLPFVGVVAFGMFAFVAIAVARRRKTATGTSVEEGDESAEEPAGESPDERPTGMSARTKALVVVATAALVVTVAVTVANSAASKWVNGTLTRTYAAADACTIAVFPLTPAGDLERDGGKLLDSLQTLTGIKTAVVSQTGPSIRVDFCDSYTNADQIRATLSGTGLTQVGAPTTSAAESSTAAPQ